jgi:outer membrane protein assembly factor BamB
MGLMTGKDLQRPAPFVPANSRWSDPIAVGTMLYTSTSAGCGGAPNAVWAIDLESESKPVVSWKSDGPIVGSLAFTTDGTLVAVTGPAIVTLDAKTLQVKDTLKALGSEFITGPTILKYGENEVIAAGAKNGHIFLFRFVNANPSMATDSDFASDSIVAADTLATWQTLDAPPTRWLLAPTRDSVAALRLSEPPQLPTVTRGWTAANLTSPATPIIVNGVVFVLERGSSAVLHAYEGATGKELWTSGKTMTGPAAPGSFWSAFGQVYVGTADGTLYAFGFTDERR